MHIAMLFKVFTENQIQNENLLLIVNKKTFTKKDISAAESLCEEYTAQRAKQKLQHRHTWV